MPSPFSTRTLSATLSLTLLALGTLSLRGAPPTMATPDTTRGRSDYVGSDVCRPCHQPAYAQWQRSVHVRMTQSSQTATVLGDFKTRQSLQGRGVTYSVAESHVLRGALTDPRRTVTVRPQNGPPDTFGVQFTLGEKRLQGYMSTLPDGRMYVLPLFWHAAWRRWIDWSEITPVTGDHDSRQIWNINCFNCHATDIQRNFDVRTRRFSTTWSEMGVGCEACHGPGRTHVQRLRAWGQDPSSYPEIGGDAPGADLTQQLAIFVPRAATSRQVFDSCAYCHGNKTNVFVGFQPGDRLDDFAQLAVISDPTPLTDPQGDYWPDGRPSRFNRPQALSTTGCFTKGQATCATCHDAHGSPNEHSLKVPLTDSDRLCTNCHQAVAPSHSHHAQDSEGSRCVGCHMSDVNWRLLTRRRDHTFAPPAPELTASFGIPNTCNTCHDDRTPEWAVRTMNAWYGNVARRRRAVAVADAMYGGGSADSTVIPSLVRFAVDRSSSGLVRASAAGFLGRMLTSRTPLAEPTPPVVNALVAAASDPEAMVRIAATRALSFVSGPLNARATAALVARTVDPSRVVRTVAAEGLLYSGVSTLSGSEGRALARAQAEYAESLRTFDDESTRHTSLGWLLASQGQSDAADAELRIAASLDPGDPRPHVFRGVVAARRGNTETAVAQFEEARRLNPTYPNIERLLAEARRAQRGP